MKRIIRYILIGLLVLLAMPILYAYLAYPAEYVNRALVWGIEDVYDYQKFSERALEASDSPFEFSFSLDEDRVRTQFEVVSGMDDFDAFLAKNRTQAFIVIQNDNILYEQYFNGSNRDTIVTSFSTAKSFTSALIGIAISEGDIHSVDDPITDYLPELAERDPAFKNITIRNLLMMSSGIKYEEFPFVSGDNVKTYLYPNLRELALEDTHIVGSPGEKFLYNNYHPLLLGLIIERATGTPVTDYLQEKIWDPVGMQYPGSWSLDENGFEKMESGINARAIDFAKFGRLFLHHGNWDSVQVIPADWIVEATREDPAVDRGEYYGNLEVREPLDGYYKYMWWGLPRSNGAYDFSAVGKHGQFIYISPQADLVIVRNGEKYGIPYDEWLQIFYQFAGAINRSPTP